MIDRIGKGNFILTLFASQIGDHFFSHIVLAERNDTNNGAINTFFTPPPSVVHGSLGLALVTLTLLYIRCFPYKTAENVQWNLYQFKLAFLSLSPGVTSCWIS